MKNYFHSASAAADDETPPLSQFSHVINDNDSRTFAGNEAKSSSSREKQSKCTAHASTCQREVGLVTIDDDEAPNPWPTATPWPEGNTKSSEKMKGKVELIPDSEPGAAIHSEDSLKMKSGVIDASVPPVAPPLFADRLVAFEHDDSIDLAKAKEQRFLRNSTLGSELGAECEQNLQPKARPNSRNLDNARVPNPILHTSTNDVEMGLAPPSNSSKSFEDGVHPYTGSTTAAVQRMSSFFNDKDEIFIPEATAVDDEDIPCATVIRPEKNSITIAGRKLQLRFLVPGMIFFLVVVVAVSVSMTKNSGGDTSSVTKEEIIALVPSDSPSTSLYPSMTPSTEPSYSPTSVLYADLMNVIANYTDGNFSDGQSMHRQAMDWLVEDQSKWQEDGRELLSDAELVERFVLALLYFETEGNGWTHSFKFLHEDHICRWREYQDRTFKKGVIRCTHGSTGRIQNLTLSNNKLRGSIPTEIGLLKELNALHIEQNSIQGIIPETLESTKISHLELSSNQLSGSIDSLASLTNLTYVNLKYNNLAGSIHSLDALSNLEAVDLSNNDMTGSLMNASNMSRLESFKAYGNMLSGSVPESFSSLTELETLHLDGNQITGDVNFLCSNLPASLKLDCFGDQDEIEVGCNCCSWCTLVNDTECDIETEKLITMSIYAGMENAGFEWEIKDSTGSIIAADGPYDDGERLDVQLCLSFPDWYHISTNTLVEDAAPLPIEADQASILYAIDGYNSSVTLNELETFYVAANPTLSPTGSPTSSMLPTTTTLSPTNPVTAWSTANYYHAEPLIMTAPPIAAPLPLIVCGGTFELELTTDSFGRDTSWELSDRNDGTVLASERAFPSNQTLHFTECLDSSICYDFIIKDDWDDGICCSQGKGSYVVSVDDRVLGNGGKFGSSETVPIGGNCGANSTEGWAPLQSWL